MPGRPPTPLRRALRGPGAIAPPSRSGLPQLVLLVITFSAFYGAIMGSSAGLTAGHWLQIVYSAVKVPLLLSVSFALTVPSYFILTSLAGLRADFTVALSSITTAQLGVSITLSSLSPFTALWYASTTDYYSHILFNAFIFAIATSPDKHSCGEPSAP